MLGTDDLPGSAVLHPVVWKLNLIAVAELLLEEAVLVVNAITDCRQVESRQGIKETGRQTPETAVTQAHVILLLTEFGDIEAKLTDSLLHVLVDPGTVEAVDIEAPHQKLEGEVVEPLHVLISVLCLGRHEALNDDALDGLGGGQPPIPLGGGLGIPRQCVLELALDEGLET